MHGLTAISRLTIAARTDTSIQSRGLELYTQSIDSADNSSKVRLELCRVFVLGKASSHGLQCAPGSEAALTVAKVTAANMLLRMVSSRDTTKGMHPPLMKQKVTAQHNIHQHSIHQQFATVDLLWNIAEKI